MALDNPLNQRQLDVLNWINDGDCAHRKSSGVLTEIPHLMAGSVYRLAGAGGGSAKGVCGGVVVA